MENNAKSLGPDWLPNLLGVPPRDVSLFKFVKAWLKGFFVSKHIHAYDCLALNAYLEGLVLWGILIKANRAAYDPKSIGHAFWGTALIAPQLSPSDALQHLPAIADWIQNNRGKMNAEWTQDVVHFMNQVDDDIFHGTESIPVPNSISVGIECSVVSALFRKQDMLGGALEMDELPVFYLKDTECVVLVNPQFWTESYKRRWLKEAHKRKEQKTSLAQQTPSAYFALQLDNLPPEQLASLESSVYELCEERKLSCLFLNLGSLTDTNGIPLPNSGELQFLGVNDECLKVSNLLLEVLSMHLSYIEKDKTRLTALGLDEFFERFDWLIDELQEQANRQE